MKIIENIRSCTAPTTAVLSRMSSTLTQKIKTFRANKEGIAAVEFALLSPIMIALYFGLVEVSLLIQADKTVSHSTNIAGDLATQITNIERDDMIDILQGTLSTMVIKDEDIADVRMEIISYRGLPGDIAEEIGRATLNGGLTGPAYDPSTIGHRLLTVGSGAVVARMQFQYEAITYKFVEQFTNLEETFVLKPRNSPEIPFSTDGTVVTYTCTATNSISVSC